MKIFIKIDKFHEIFIESILESKSLYKTSTSYNYANFISCIAIAHAGLKARLNLVFSFSVTVSLLKA